MQQSVPVGDTPGDETDRYPMRLGMLQDAVRQFPHQCLAVGSTLTGDDEGGIPQHLIEADSLQ